MEHWCGKWHRCHGRIRGRNADRAPIDALILSVSVAVATLIVAATMPAATASLLCLPFLILPTLPFFGMQVSETATLHSLYAVFAASTFAVVLGTDRTEWIGLPLGLSVALIFGAGRTSWPMLPLVAAVIAAAVMFAQERSRKASALFWGGLARTPAALVHGHRAVSGAAFVRHWCWSGGFWSSR